jgi:hypothetical protein
MRRSALVTALLAVLLAAAPAQAATPDRSAARGIAKATKRVQAAVAARRPEMQPAVERWIAEPCKSALEGVPDGDPAIAALELSFGYFFETALFPAKADLERFGRALGRVKVRDKVLRTGRAAYRRDVRAALQLNPPPEDICARLDAWRQAGYPAEQAPKLADPGLDALYADGEAESDRIARAGKRLRKLGVKLSVVKAWNGGGIGALIPTE